MFANMPMSRLPTFVLCLMFSAGFAFTQESGKIKGSVHDAQTGEPLSGATIRYGEESGVVSASDGTFLIQLGPGNVSLSIQYLGYQGETRSVTIKAGETQVVDIRLHPSESILDEVVVSGGKFEQKLSDLTISMEVIKPLRLINTNTTSLETLMDQTPGLTILDGQPNIRGGSGYSYGTGSRVLMLVNDLPMLSADASDVKWDVLPLENIAQIEVVKGASSVLYGTSALNGVINVRTAFPGIEPETRVTSFAGFYMNPRRKETIWWDRQRWLGGINFSHSRRFGNLDLVAGADLFTDEGYRKDETEKRFRLNADLRYRNKKVPGLNYGVRSTLMGVDKSDFLLWQDADSGALKQNPTAISKLGGSRFYLDPYIEYQKSNGTRHSLSTRLFSVNNIFKEATDKNNRFVQFFGEYKFHRDIGEWGKWTCGLSGTTARIVSNLFGDHSSAQAALFGQVDGEPLKNLIISFGLRWENYWLDKEVESSKPVFRSGINYQLARATWLRASFGQGYRFPSVAEKFAATSVGALNIFPNPDLKSEQGWSTEAGFKQGFKISGWNGYLDLAAFRMQYSDMIEFTFGVYNPDTVPPTLDWVGFKSLNIGNARINGFEVVLAGDGKIGAIQTTLTTGYNYINPIDLDNDSTDNFLKYRYRHSAKADVELGYKRFSLGATMVYNSFMVNIDEVFVDPIIGALILPGYASYREAHHTGYAVFDLRAAINLNRTFRLAVIGRNVFNKEYMGRPADIRPPRNITVQLMAKF